MYFVSAFDCEMSARGISPCLINGRDWGEFIYPGVFSGYVLVLFVVPWLVMGGICVGFIAWLDRDN